MDENQTLRISFCVFIEGELRLDRYLAALFSLSRAQAKLLIQSGHVYSNNTTLRSAHRVSRGHELSLIQMANFAPQHVVDATITSNEIQSADWCIPILYSDDAVLVINKPAGLIVHGGPSITDVTLVDILASLGMGFSGGDPTRLGMVHRLDQFTEGLMVFAKTEHALHHLKQQFKDRLVKKRYYTVLHGVLSASEGRVDRPIGRDASIRARQSCHHYVSGTERSAVTMYRVLHQMNNICFVDVQLITGRTHQIRVHFASLNCPVLGDTLYSNQPKKSKGYLLQSYFLGFHHPISGDWVQYELPVSDRLKKYAGNADEADKINEYG